MPLVLMLNKCRDALYNAQQALLQRQILNDLYLLAAHNQQ